MATLVTTANNRQVITKPSRLRLFLSAARYLAGKAITILITIFAGVFLTMLIVNYPMRGGDAPGMSPFEMRLQQQIDSVVQIAIYQGMIRRNADGWPDPLAILAFQEKIRTEAGLNLQFLPRYLLWTYKALTFNWGTLDPQFFVQLGYGVGLQPRITTHNVVLQYLPNTLLLVGTAYLLVFLLGMPLSLYLARHYGTWLDRVLSVLSPISSVPSWVFAIVLLTIFAVQLRWLPVAGMFDFHKPSDPLLYAFQVARHMVLPVFALVLSLLFQLVYTWRTFLIIYSEEDYVDLARAKGLATGLLEKQYILRPALPYVMTSFATSLIGFWQLTVALEKIFGWPGIGLLYIQVLPNYWGDSVKIGDLMIVIQIVVLFSYLLGIVVFILDLAYVIVDPRIHLVPASSLAQTSARLKTKRGRRNDPFAWMNGNPSVLAQPVRGPVKERISSSRENRARNNKEIWREFRERIRLFSQQLRAYPSAIFGLVIITLLIAGSIYAVVELPYEQIGKDYDARRSTGINLRPGTAAPSWVNFFSKKPYLSTLIMDESNSATISLTASQNGWIQKTVTFQFDYPYKEIPSDVFIYLDSTYTEKLPFVSMRWLMPDGQVINLKSKALGGEKNYDLQASIPTLHLLGEHPEWRNWFVTDGQYPTPAYKLLFAQSGSSRAVPQHGKYRLEITSLLFEKGSDVQSKLVLLGQVYGIAGTDYWRRDLIVPLFWGMPFALVVGFIGTLLTTLFAMLLPAIGVWFGGALDDFIQRLTEINMVLPGLAIAVLLNLLFDVSIWVVLGIVVVLSSFGAPIKTFRSAFLQAKEAPYIEMARSYGASNFRIITRYLIPRILPVLIPHLITQIPTFIFLEATLGFFNIKSDYPSWGRIIYEGLSRGALYGSPFWVLEPIFLLLLTGLAFAMLGSALERILNPRIIENMPVYENKT